MANDDAPGGLRQWIPLAMLAAGQFVMVLDSSVMNVSITQIVEDLDTTVAGVQLAITAYTLVMAAFMLVGAKLGAIWGTSRAFAIGLAVYGLGSLITAFSPNLAVLMIGWSLIEGLGAVLVIPAIAALVIANYEGKQRALAYGLLGGASGAAIAAGPLIGGWVTSTWTWRYVFAGETVVMVMLLLARGVLRGHDRTGPKPTLDYGGAVLSALGLALGVFGVLKSGEWGWILPTPTPPSIGGHDIEPLGFSLVPFLIVGGLGLLWWFESYERRREAAGRAILLDLSMLRITAMRAGLLTLVMQQVVLLGAFFLLPVYLQMVLGYDAFETGKRLLPLSIALFVAALLGPRLAGRSSPRRVANVGLFALVAASLTVAAAVDVKLEADYLDVALALFGVGAGLLLSQLGNVIMSSVDPSQTNEAGGLQGAAQNLGASLGTALVGSVLIAGLSTGFAERIEQNSSIPASVKTQVQDATKDGVDVLPVTQVEQAVIDAGGSSTEATEISDDYADAEVAALKEALFVVALLATIGFWPARRLPHAHVEQVREPSTADVRS